MSHAVEAVSQPRRRGLLTAGRRGYPIAAHLALFAAGILVPVLLIVTFMVVETARLWQDDALHDARLIAQHLNATIDLELEKSIAVAETLAAGAALDGGDTARFDAEAREVASQLGVNIVARDLSGQQLVNTFRPPGATLPSSDQSIQAIDRQAAARKNVVVSNLRIAMLRGTPTVTAVVPVIKGGVVTAFISASMPPARFVEILQPGLPPGWIAGLIGRDGRLIARSVDQANTIGTANPAFLAVATQTEGEWTGVSREGMPIAGVYLRSPLSGWIVSVAVPQAILRAPTHAAVLSLVGLVAASLAVSLLLGWWLSRRIAPPIRDLASRARELGEGRTPAAGWSGVAEVDAVSAALRSASVELERRAEAADHAAEAVRVNQERLQLVQDTAGLGTVDLDIAADRAVCSPRYYALFGLPPDHAPGFGDFLARVHAADRTRVEQSRLQLFRLGGPFEDEFRIVTPEGEERWIYTRGRVDLKDGAPARLVAASIDITVRKQSEEHLRFLLRELSHRSKNLLAVIQAMAGQTAKSAESVDAFRRRFGERLMGLAASHDLLVNQNWLGASVGQLVLGQLAPFVDPDDPRLHIHGPAINLKAEAAEALGLALHELATNSVKYGALRDQAGQIEIAWRVYRPDESGPADGRRFRVDWVEHTADPVAPPSHKGFGRMVIEHTVEATFAGRVTLDFPPEGLRWHLDGPESCLAPADRAAA